MYQKLISNKTTGKPLKIIIPSSKKVPCSWPKCQRIFLSLRNLEKHFKVHNEGSYKCNYCYTQFQYKSSLHRHIRIHTGEKPYACRFCPKSFSNIGNLKSHTRIHTGEKPFKCKICHKCFSESTKLQIHFRTHTGEKPYNCEICAKTFADSTNLVRHERIHTGDKPYKCTFCLKSFCRHGHLQDHMRIHTRERPYNCTICSKSFTQQSYLQVHKRTHTDKMQNKPKNCKQQTKRMQTQVLGGHKKGFLTRARTTRMRNKSEGQNKQFTPLICQVCHLVFPSLQDLCRHYSLQHNLPKVRMQNLIFRT